MLHKKHLLAIGVFVSLLNIALHAEDKNIVKKEDVKMEQMKQLINKVQPGDLYEHYKGKQYRILNVSCNTEDLTWYVVYEALYDNDVSQIWHRPIDMFLGELEVDGKVIQRFKRVD